jgi:hypothetical protein
LKTKGPSREDDTRAPSPPALQVEAVPETNESLDLGSSLVEDSDCDEEDDPVVPSIQQEFTAPTSVEPPKKKVVKKRPSKSDT